MEPMIRHAVRAILIDDEGRLLLIRRTKPGQQPYWTAPGGRLEASDTSLEDALRREVAEELSGKVELFEEVFSCNTVDDDLIVIQHFFTARLTAYGKPFQSGPEFNKSQDQYDLDKLDFCKDDLAIIDLRPAALKDFLQTNKASLISKFGLEN